MNRNNLIAASMICLAATLLGVATSRPSESAAALRNCTRLFGPAVDKQRHLFAVNEFYVLGLEFNERGKLVGVDVSPKYFFEEAHPEWAEPHNFAFLSKAQYDAVLAQIDTIKPRGRLVKGSDRISVVTNMTAPHRERYRHATLEWGELIDLRRGEDAPLLVRWIRVHYSR